LRSLPILFKTTGLSVLAGLASCLIWNCENAQAEPLQARIEHTERMPSVEPVLKPGAIFNLSADEAADDVWVKVPDWLAGTWSIRRETTVYHQNFRTGDESYARRDFDAHTTFTYAQQRDREGGYWHYLGTPYTSQTELSTFTEYHKVAEKELVESDPTKAVVRTRVTVIRTDKETSKITKVFQQESITRYTRMSSDELQLISSTKVFDDSGNATDEVQNEARVHRLSPYSEIDFVGDKNYKAMFVHFLVTHELANLVPDQL